MSADVNKRKLDDDAPLASDSKRHKGDNAGEADTASLAATDGSSDTERDENLRSVSDASTADLEATGPLVFYCWADAILYIFEEAGELAYVVLKPTALEAWEHVKHLPKGGRYEALEDHVHGVKQYDVTVPDGATRTPEAKALKKAWDAVRRGVTRTKEGGDDDDDAVGWWYEVDAQREKPKEGPALELRFDWKETWWVTGFRESDTEGRRAMCTLVDYLCVDY